MSREEFTIVLMTNAWNQMLRSSTLLSATVSLRTLLSHFLVSFLCRLNDELFLYSRLWCIYFSGCITFGTIGRRLAASDSAMWGTWHMQTDIQSHDIYCTYVCHSVHASPLTFLILCSAPMNVQLILNISCTFRHGNFYPFCVLYTVRCSVIVMWFWLPLSKVWCLEYFCIIHVIVWYFFLFQCSHCLCINYCCHLPPTGSRGEWLLSW